MIGEKTALIPLNGIGGRLENPNQLRLDDKHVYSDSGMAYRRVSCRNPSELHERRLPLIKVVKSKGHTYHYFVSPLEGRRRLPAPSDSGFDHAYLCELARMEGKPAPSWGGHRASKVYFIQAETGQIKIGVALVPDRRLAGLQIGSPVKLKIKATTPGGQPMEREYHQRFAAHRLHGEWFAPHPDILDEITRLNQEQPA